MPRTKKKAINLNTKVNLSLIKQIQDEFIKNKSYTNLVLGLLVVIVAGVLAFNYFKGSPEELGPAQNTQITEDASVENLPGTYTVKAGDTLFLISQKYYSDGYKYTMLAAANKISNPDVLELGQVLNIPTLSELTNTTGGETNLTAWGEKIAGNTYVVATGDWLSTIAGRAYGNPMAYTKIALANNISDVNLIEPGQTLKIPR